MASVHNNQATKRESAYSSWVVEYMVYFYFALAFFEQYLFGVVGNITKYYIFIVMGIIILQFGYKLQIYPFHVPMLIWIVYLFLSLLWTDSFTIFRLNMLTIIGMVAFFVVLTMDAFTWNVIHNIAIVTWLCSFILAVLSLTFSKSYSGVLETRQVLVMFGQEVDPNNQAVYILMGISIAVYYLMYCRKYIIPSLITLFVNSISLFMTGSRGGLVSLIAIAVFVLLFNTEKKGVASIFIKLMCFAGGVFIVILALKKYIPEDIFTRLTDVSSYEGGSNRTEIWMNGLNLLLEDLNLLFGAGWGCYFSYNGFNAAMHNTYLAMLCDVGIFGLLLFFCPVFKRVAWCMRRKEYLPVLLLLSVFIPSFFIDSINKRFFWNAILFLYMFVMCRQGENCDENKVSDW